jgi:ribosomal protein S8
MTYIFVDNIFRIKILKNLEKNTFYHRISIIENEDNNSDYFLKIIYKNEAEIKELFAIKKKWYKSRCNL